MTIIILLFVLTLADGIINYMKSNKVNNSFKEDKQLYIHLDKYVRV